MEPLGAAASIAAVIQITQSLGLILRSLYQNIVHARTEIEKLYDSVISFELILKELRTLGEQRRQGMVNITLLQHAQGPLEKATSQLASLKEKIGVQTLDGRFEKRKLSTRQGTLRSLSWPFKKGEVVTIVQTLDELKQTLIFYVGVSTLSKEFEQCDILEDIKRGMSGAQDDVKRQKVLQWLSTSIPNMSVAQNDDAKRRQEFTGSWLLNGEDLEKWSTTPNSFLWLHGAAGAGKSVLCATVIDHFKHKCQSAPNSALVYWYFSFRNAASQRFDHCLRSMIGRLCSGRSDLPEGLQKAHDNAIYNQELPGTDDLMTILRTSLDEFEHVYMFFDALDECPKYSQTQVRDRDQLLERINEIRSWGENCLHIFATSRNERDIEESLTDLSAPITNFTSVTFQGEAVENDIKAYIRKRLSAHQFKTCRKEIKEEIESKLTSQANGMFRLVALQLDRLLKMPSVRGIKTALDTLPISLDEFYQQLLNEIHRDYQEYAVILLHWLAVAARPLALRELAEVCAIRPRAWDYLDPEDRLEDNKILGILPAGLIRTEVKEYPNFWSRYERRCKKFPTDDHSQYYGTFVEFSHFSVLEYLKSDRVPVTFHITQAISHSIVAEACITYYLYMGREEGKNSAGYETGAREGYVKRALQLEATYPLAEYAGRAWPYHTAQIGTLENDDFDSLALYFLDQWSEPWKLWCLFVFENDLYWKNVSELCSYITPLPPQPGESQISFIHPLTWVSWLGTNRFIALLLRDSGVLANVTYTSTFGKPLHAAAYSGNEDSVKLLLAAGADQNELGGNFGTPLAAACAANKTTIAKLLLESGAEVNKRGSEWFLQEEGTPLMKACFRGHFEIVELLLKFGANINLLIKAKNALTEACRSGSIRLVDFLIRSGADVNVQDEDGDSVLIAALKTCPADQIGLLMSLLFANFKLKQDLDSAFALVSKGYEWNEHDALTMNYIELKSILESRLELLQESGTR